MISSRTGRDGRLMLPKMISLLLLRQRSGTSPAAASRGQQRSSKQHLYEPLTMLCLSLEGMQDAIFHLLRQLPPRRIQSACFAEGSAEGNKDRSLLCWFSLVPRAPAGTCTQSAGMHQAGLPRNHGSRRPEQGIQSLSSIVSSSVRLLPRSSIVKTSVPPFIRQCRFS